MHIPALSENRITCCKCFLLRAYPKQMKFSPSLDYSSWSLFRPCIKPQKLLAL